jgi:leucyl/phenylalanyl-tRNA--protein transferase
MTILSFPPIENADENGLVAIGGDLDVDSLKLAYSQGIFPWPISEELPLAWFSPDPRGILQYKHLHISTSLKKLMKREKFKIKFNSNFEAVILNCARVKNRKDGPSTWITNEIIEGYINLHRAGHAYSVEAFLDIDGEEKLVGGMYGVCIGGNFSGESMFYNEPNASKVALVTLMERLNQNGISWLDTQMVTPVVENLGGHEIPRDLFLNKLTQTKDISLTEVFD